jgi:hypothetical protein
LTSGLLNPQTEEKNMACEKCWGDAYFRWRFVDGTKSQSEHYRELLEERKDNPCTPEEEAGKAEEN